AGIYHFTIKATDTNLGISRSQAYTLTVNPAVASYTITAPSTATAGTGFNVTITAKDSYGNSVNGPRTPSNSDGQNLTPATVTLVNGTVTVPVVLKTAGTITLTASGSGLKSTSNSITISPAAAVAFAVSAPSKVTAGSAFNVTVTARDAFGNTATGYRGTV